MAQSKKNKKNDVSGALARSFGAMSSIIRERLSSLLGQDTFGGDRNVYTALGYPTTLTYEDYYLRFKRDGIARRIVLAPVQGCWQTSPRIESDDKGFEKKAAEIVAKYNLWQVMKRVDVLLGIGTYSVLLLGFDDVNTIQDFSKPVADGASLIYIRPYSSDSATINSFVRDVSDPRYGFPETYSLEFNSSKQQETQSYYVKAHHSRVVHIVENPVVNSVYSAPRLEPVYNRLIDIERVMGGSSEMFWRGAFPGQAFVMDKDAEIGPQTEDDIEDQLDEYVHNLRRFLQLKGMEVKNLSGHISDPINHIRIQFQGISATTGIPMRILTGSERGELASTQDESAWNIQLHERRQNFVNNTIIRSFFDRIIQHEALPEAEYKVVWDDLWMPSKKEVADIAKKQAEALARYSESVNSSLVVPPHIFLKEILQLDESTVDAIQKETGGMISREQGDLSGVEGEEE